MSMLSESRRKKHWSLDPRNKNWSDDCNTLGKKMMEKMGWQNGKGLGAKEQGLTENLKVCMKNNKLGVGASLKGMDTWTSHLDTYSQLLTELGTCHRQPDESSPTRHKDTVQETSPFSLEEKSKKSKKRVHYMKFAKGKDLSMRSANDMVCIFGKPSGTVVGDLSPPVSCISVEELSPGKTMSEEKKKILHGIPTVTSHLSMHEYFAKKKSQNVETTAEQRRASGTAVECPSVKKSKRRKIDEDDIDVVANNRRRRKGSNTTSKHHGNLEEQTLREERNRKKKMNN